MFKPLLRTLPTLSGNFTIACKLREFDKENTNEYSTYIRLANMIPLQNFLANKNIELNLLNGKYEYDLIKYFYHYSNYFYKENFQYDKNNYKMLDLDSLYNNTNDTRNKDYEFGCKRIQYSEHGSQFNFYAPIYIDNVNNLPEYFCIHIVLNDHLEKKIKVYINKNNKRNYLKNYLTRYLKQIDDRVIFCLPESLQATYFGIDVKNGGIVQYKDNTIGNIYNNQMTINNFDFTICQGFERNKLIMRQIIPLSFSFNLNDIFTKYEKETLSGSKIKIYGFYYTKSNISYDLFDFDINYTNMYQKYNKYDKHTGRYNYALGHTENNKKINIMNIGFPALNESKYTKYAYTNKITPRYCKFKMNLSHDSDPYITNINFAYSYIQYPNQKYGYFPTMFKGIYVEGIIINNDLKLPIGYDLETYYNTTKYIANKVYINTANGDKYIKLMSNYCSSWFNINEYSPDFNDHKFLNSLFNNENYWEDVKYDYSYFKGILYNLNSVKKYNIDKFGVFLCVNMNSYTQEEINNSVINGKYILSTSDISTVRLYQYDNSMNMIIEDENTGITYYNKIFNVLNNSIIYDNGVKTKYLFNNKNMKLDERGKYIEEKHYIEENIFYKISDITNHFKNYINQEINNDINKFNIIGYLLLDGMNNINYFEEYNSNGKKYKKFILENKKYKIDDRFKWLYKDLYYSSASNTIKTQIGDNVDIQYNEDVFDKICMYIKTDFIHKSDLIEIFINHNCLNLISYLHILDTYIFEHIGNYNGIDITNYFIKNENYNIFDVYVDTYNLNYYIDLYNKNHIDKISKDFDKTKEYYFKALNKDHIIEYYNNLNKDEFNNTTFNFAYKDIIDNNTFYSYSNILDNIYVKERCWKIENQLINPIDRYLSLYDYLKRYDENLIVHIHSFFKNKDILNWLIDNISDTRTLNNNFLFKFGDINIELNLCFKKCMTILNESLMKIIKNNHFLYLYIKYKDINENMNIWPIISKDDINNNQIKNSLQYYDYRAIDDYLLPLYNSPYINDNDCKNLFNMIQYNKINEYGKYILNVYKYFKEIDVDKEILELCSEDKEFAYNWIELISNFKINENKIYSDEYINNLYKNWNEYCLINQIYIENISEYDDYIQQYENNDDDLYNYYMNLKNKSYKKYITNILDFIKEYDNGDIYYKLIKNKGIILYSFVNKDEIKLNNININNDNLIYDEVNNMYIYNDNESNKIYGFYWISLNIDNTNNSFYIKDDYNLNLTFNSINGVDIQSSKFNNYLNNIFYLIYPLLKINVFNEYSKMNNSIIYPYESEINIEHIQSLLNDNDYNKYTMLKETSSDLLYGEIIKILDSKKIKLLRYFNYISPYLKRTNIIEDCWKLRFMYNDNPYKNIKKYNIFDKDNINIYKYDGIKLYDGIYSKSLYQYSNYSLIQQYEYKHFEDNVLFNLPEEIIIHEKKYYTYNEIIHFENNEKKIKDKKIEILLKYFEKKGFDYKNISLFLFNKYDSNMIIEHIRTKSSISEKLYKITYKFNLI